MALRAYFCPCCGARLEPPTARLVACAYCDARLEADVEHVSGQASHAEVAQPEARLSQWTAPRFEVSVLEQVESPAPEAFLPLELPEERFALVSLRVVDVLDRALEHTLPLEVIRASLEEEPDPGLAANRALEWCCEQPQGFPHRLELAILLFDPDRATLVAYSAGCQGSLWWMSSEEGRCTDAGDGRGPLERRMLREARDHFRNSRTVYLAGGDLVVLVSAGYAGRGGGAYSGGLYGLTQALNEQLGEDPLRVVTMAKNAFWERRAPAAREEPLAGPIRVAAVRVLPPPEAAAPNAALIQRFGTRRFELALWAGPGDHLELLPLHDDRWVLLWLSDEGLELAPERVAAAREALLEVLDRREHGDNENPREAGRRALQRAGGVRLQAVQLFDRWNRVKYFRSGFQQALALGARGLRDPASMQQFDEGGEVTVGPGERLFFPGRLAYHGDAPTAEALAEHWPGGKASRLYQALADHWKIPRAAAALEVLARAALSDQPGAVTAGLGLVGGLR